MDEERLVILLRSLEAGVGPEVASGGTTHVITVPDLDSETLQALLEENNASGRYANGGGSGIRATDLSLDLTTRSVRWRNKRFRVSHQEFLVLLVLLRAEGEVCTFEELQSRVWGDPSRRDTSAVRSCMKRLRRKLEREGVELDIRSVPAVGFRLAPLLEA